VQLVEKCVSKMKNLKEIKLMMERLESPRLTETELNYKKSLLKEEDEEVIQDPDQLDLFTGETKEVNELVAQFEELKRLILDEIEGLDINYLYTAMSMGQMDRELEDYYNLVQRLENWIDSNDFEGELMAEANNLLEILEYGPIDYEITLTPEVEELLKRERPGIKVGSEKEISDMSEGKDEMGRMVMDVDTYREYLIKQMKNKGLLSSEDKKEYLERWLKYQEPIGGKKKMADRIEAAQTLLDEL
jgi:hypothetical protein